MAEIAMPLSTSNHLRRLDMRRDLAKVADLVELCFYDTLDPEGRQYLNEMRKAGQNASLLGWASNLIDETPMPPSGYVWEVDDRLVGSLSLIPINVHGKRCYMIANVATHPDYRGRGIAMALTTTALRHAREKGSASVWLQVREDNPVAIHIYEANGFKEHIRRTSWYSGPNPQEKDLSKSVRISNRKPDQWILQRAWLDRIYPPNLTWQISIDWNLFRPDLWGKIYRATSLEFPHHWSVERDSELKGILSWMHTRQYTDMIWLAVPEQIDEEAVLSLLVKARNNIPPDQPLSLNFPANFAIDVLHQAGFYSHQTLIWMEKSFGSDNF